MAEILLKPSSLSKIIPLSFDLNDTNASNAAQLMTKRQFNTADTDAWFEVNLEGSVDTSGSFDITLFNLNDKAVFNHTGKPFTTNPFYYKLDSESDETKNEIRHAGRWIGQIVVTLANGNSATRKFIFDIEGHILDGADVQTILLEDYNALIATINTSKDLLAQYNVDYAALLVDLAAAETARTATYNQLVADQQANIDAFDVALDTGIVAANLAEKLQDFEETNNSRLLSTERQLAETNELSAEAVAKADAMASGSPKGVYATLALLQAAYPTGTTGAYLVSADGNWYYWNGTAWTSGGVYQSVGLGQNAVKMVNAAFVKGANLFSTPYLSTNLTAETIGMDLAGVFTSKTEIKSGLTYRIKTVGTHNRFIVYLSNDTAQGSPAVALASENPSTGNKDFSFTNTDGYKYLWVFYHYKASSIAPVITVEITDSDELVLGTTSVLKKKNSEIDKLLLSLDVQDTLNFAVPGKRLNLFDKTNVISDVFIKFDTGGASANKEYVGSDYIVIKPSTGYIVNHFDQVAFYDKYKNYLSGVSGYQLGTTTFTTPVNTRYIRASVRKVKLDLYMLVEGATLPVLYEPFGIKVTVDSLSQNLNRSLNKLVSPKHIASVLFNAGTTVNIKLIGDSITAGVGGTGYNPIGETIYSSYKTNDAGTCWANSVKSYFQSKFNCTVKNWGVSGKSSQDLVDNLSTLVTASDHIVICMIGTNDRIDYLDNSITKLYNNLLTIGDYVRGQGKEIIFMSAPPASVANENIDYTRRFHMEDADTAIMVASDYFNMEYISIYKAFMNYCDLKGISVDTLIPDGVHPNDAGYALMFNIVCDNLGIGRKRVGANW